MGKPNKPCNECPFLVENRHSMCPIMIDQMAANSYDIGGFPCHKTNPGNDILTCPSEAHNAKDCVGYAMMRQNLAAGGTVNPDVVFCFDDLIRE